MGDNGTSRRRRRGNDVPLYSIADAARYSRTKPPTLRRWALGYDGADGSAYPPLLALPDKRPGGEPALSWENLVEAALLTHWRTKRISLQRLRRAHELAIEEFGPHPLARLAVYSDGLELFMAADAAESTFDWQSQAEAPYQWRPPGGDDLVRLDPEINFGQPGVRRIRTEIIFGRWMAREALREIADDFGLDPPEVETAIRYEVVLQRPPLALAA